MPSCALGGIAHTRYVARVDNAREEWDGVVGHTAGRTAPRAPGDGRLFVSRGAYTGRVPRSANHEYHVDVAWDDEAGVWTATSPDVVGLTLEYESLDRLQDQVMGAVAELLELNGQPPADHVDVAVTRRVLAYA